MAHEDAKTIEDHKGVDGNYKEKETLRYGDAVP